MTGRRGLPCHGRNKMGRKYIYKFLMDCGRNGDITSVFIATEEEVNALIGKNFFFSEPFGKFSEVSGDFEESYFSRVECDESAVAVVESLGILPTKYNPFDYVCE